VALWSPCTRQCNESVGMELAFSSKGKLNRYQAMPCTQFSELSKNLKYSRHLLEKVFQTENYFAVRKKIHKII